MKPSYTFIFLLGQLLKAYSAYYQSVPEGDPNWSMSTPFLEQNRFTPSVRFQQVFDESGFFRAGGQQLLITATTFYYVPGHTAPDFTLSNVEMRFSVTPQRHDGLSSTFAENIGANETLVHSGPLEIHSVYDIPYSTVTIPLQTPYFYDRSAGNLLLDVRNYATANFGSVPPGSYPEFFAMDRTSDFVSSVEAWRNVNSQVGTPYTAGLITTFTFEIVPEPSASVLMLAGLGVLGLAVAKPWRRGLGGTHVSPSGPGRSRG